MRRTADQRDGMARAREHAAVVTAHRACAENRYPDWFAAVHRAAV